MEIVEVEDIGIPGKVGIRYNLGDTRKATSKCFAKVVTRVDTSKQNGYAFEGKFIRNGDIVDVGSYIILVRGVGSWKYPCSEISLYKVHQDCAEELGIWDWNTRADKVRAILEIAKIVNSSTEEEQLREQLKALVERYGKEKVLKTLNEL